MTEGIMKIAQTYGEEIEKERMKYLERVLLGRYGEPDEVAKAALFLASDLLSYVNEALIPVDGEFLST